MSGSTPPGAPITDRERARHPRHRGLTIVTAVFALFAVNDWGQFFQHLFGTDTVPQSLIVLRFLAGAAGYIAAFGTWRRRSWAWIAALAWGLTSSALIFSVPTILHLGETERQGIVPGTIAALLMGGGLSLYLRSVLPRRDAAHGPPAP